MARSAPLQVTVRMELLSGPAAGRRCHRLTERVELPPRLLFPRELPIEGEGFCELSFALPGGPQLSGRARLCFDPARPELGSRAELLGLSAEACSAIEAYIDERQPE